MHAKLTEVTTSHDTNEENQQRGLSHLHDVEPHEEREEGVAVDVQGIHPLHLLLHGMRPVLQQATVRYPPATPTNKQQLPVFFCHISTITGSKMAYLLLYSFAAPLHFRSTLAEKTKQLGPRANKRPLCRSLCCGMATHSSAGIAPPKRKVPRTHQQASPPPPRKAHSPILRIQYTSFRRKDISPNVRVGQTHTCRTMTSPPHTAASGFPPSAVTSPHTSRRLWRRTPRRMRMLPPFKEKNTDSTQPINEQKRRHKHVYIIR